MRNSLHALKIFTPTFLILFGLGVVPALATNQELQFGYVFDTWNSNSIKHGQESRLPLSYKISGENYAFNLSTAFVLGDYEEDGVGSFKASDLSDTVVRGTMSFPMGGGLS